MVEFKAVMDYFAPEIKKSAMDKDNSKIYLDKSDIWSWGALFFKQLYSETPIFDLQGHPNFPKKPA
jgi:hypothetical protein